MAKYLHISKSNSFKTLCGTYSYNVVFLFWATATCPRCRRIAERDPSNVSWLMGTPQEQQRPERYWKDGRVSADT